MTKKIDKPNIRSIIENNYIFGLNKQFYFHTVDISIKGRGVLQIVKQASSRDANRTVLIWHTLKRLVLQYV